MHATGDSRDDTTVLVVEDDPDLADLYAEWLTVEYEIRTAQTGARAREAFDTSIDIVLVDRQLSGRFGGELLTDIRSTGSPCRVAVVTALEPDVDILDLPFDECLVEPVSKHDLRETVDRLRTLHEYDEILEEQLALARKKALLEAYNSRLGLQDHERYGALTARLDELNTRLETRAADLDVEEFRLLYRDIDRRGSSTGASPTGTRPNGSTYQR